MTEAEEAPKKAKKCEKQGRKLNKKFAQWALGLFAGTSFGIVFAYAVVLGYGLRSDMTISRYVGLSLWTVGIFAVSNLVVAILFLIYMRGLKEEWGMSRLWWIMAVVAAIFLMVLSIFPAETFDTVPGQYGVVTIIHRVSSMLVFLMMALTMAGLLLKVKKWFFKWAAGAFVFYAAVMAVVALTHDLMSLSCLFWLESSFLIGYLVLLCLVPKNPDREKCDIMGDMGR